MTINEDTGVASEKSLAPLTMSRRTTLQAVLAAALASKMVGIPRFATAQAASTPPWNWGGNAGHTGELPGPGLDVSSALGELWRVSRDEFGNDTAENNYVVRVAGSANGVIYTMNGESLWARRLQDGAFLWAKSPATVRATITAPATSVASPPADVEPLAFSSPIAIDNDILLVPVNNGHVWGLDAATGELRWDVALQSVGPRFRSGPPTVVDHIAYGNADGRVTAVELTDPPTTRWSTEVAGRGFVLGVHDGYVYVAVVDPDPREPSEIRALSVVDGSEFWRVSLGDLGGILTVYGVSSSGIAIFTRGYESNLEQLVLVNRDGQVAWSVSGDDFSTSYGWMVDDAITTSHNGYDNWRFETVYPESGNLNWRLIPNTNRWDNVSDQPVMCAGKAYALVYDYNQQKNLLIIVDPVTAEVVGAWDSLTIPVFIADGILLAQDYDTGEIFAIGPAPAVLQAGGRATVTRDVTLRGAPSDTAIERAQVTAGTLVDVTGDVEASNGTEWMPVTLSETNESGWLPADALAGQDGPIRFSAIDINEFGQFTSFPKFNSGTKAEITEQVVLRGAPSDSSAQKATLDVGTIVTVTSAPTTAESDGVEWCPINVDATGESGWVPTSVLKVVPSA